MAHPSCKSGIPYPFQPASSCAHVGVFHNRGKRRTDSRVSSRFLFAFHPKRGTPSPQKMHPARPGWVLHGVLRRLPAPPGPNRQEQGARGRMLGGGKHMGGKVNREVLVGKWSHLIVRQSILRRTPMSHSVFGLEEEAHVSQFGGVCIQPFPYFEKRPHPNGP